MSFRASAHTGVGIRFSLESGTGKVCRPPPPRRLEMAIMLSMESMRHHGAWQQKITRPPKSSRVKQFSQQLWPRYWQRPGSSALRIWLSRINRHHSDRLAGIFTPFRRRDKPGSRCPVVWFSLLYYAMHNISTEKNIGCSVRFYGFGAATSAVGVTAGASIARITALSLSFDFLTQCNNLTIIKHILTK